MLVNNEQIRFHQKELVEAEEGSLCQVRLICPEESRVVMLFGVELTHASDFGFGAKLTLLTVRF